MIESAQADEKTPSVRGRDTAKAQAGCGVGVCVGFPGPGARGWKGGKTSGMGLGQRGRDSMPRPFWFSELARTRAVVRLQGLGCV